MIAPIVQAALALAAGAAFALRIEPPAAVALGGLAFALAGCAGLLRTRTTPALLLVFSAMGCALGTTAGLRAGIDCRVRLNDGAAVVATGRFTTLPDSGARAMLRADRLRAGGITCGDVELRVDLDESLRSTDALVRVEGTWLRWPAEGFVRPDRAGMLRVATVAALDAPAGLTMRERLQLDAQRRTRMLYGTDAPLVEALLLARTETLPRDVRARFADSGLVHLLAISGTHVVLILGVLLVLAQAARLSGRNARLCAFAGVVAYVLFLGAPPPAARAALQLGLLSIGRALQRPSDALSALAVSALLLIVIEPTVVVDAGAQLSFAGVGGIIAFAPALERLMRRLPRVAVRPLAAGMAASATTLPIAGLHFGTLAPIGILAGLPGIPITAVAVPASALPIMLSFVSQGAAAFLVPAAALSLRALDRVAAIAAAVPGGHGFASPGDIHTLLFGAAAAILALRATDGWLEARTGARARQSVSSALLSGAVGAAALTFVLGMRPVLTRAVGGSLMELHVLDVGQGDALAIRSPRGRWLLVDTGPRSRTWDAGAARVVPYLERHHAREIAAIVLTHPHADHIGGTVATLAAFDVHALLEPAQAEGRSMYVETLDAARRHGARWIVARVDTRLEFDGMTLDVLHPRNRLDRVEDANDYSAVVLVRYGDFAALLLGDAPTEAEEWILARDPALRAQVIKVGHHGSTTSSGETLLRRVRPALALISVGRRNWYGHPEPEILQRLARYGVVALRTDQHGTIVVRADARGRFRVTTER